MTFQSAFSCHSCFTSSSGLFKTIWGFLLFSVILLLAALCQQVSAQQNTWIDGANLQEDLNSMRDQGLGVQKWQNYFDGLTFSKDAADGQTLLNQLEAKLSAKFQRRITELKALKTEIEASYESFSTTWGHSKCCELTNLRYDEGFKIPIDTSKVCEQISSTAKSVKKYINDAVINKMKANLKSDSSLKWQYYGDESGVMTMYPANKFTDCVSYDPRYRPWYVAAATPTKKEVVIVIDKSGSMGNTHHGKTLMDIAKSAANTVLETLGPDDLIGVVSFSSYSGTDADCYSRSLAMATPQNINKLKKYVNSLRAGGGTRYTLGLGTAFKLFKQTTGMNLPGEVREKVILFLSDGIPSETHSEIMESLRNENKAVSNKVILLTYGLGQSLASSAQSILRRMASQDTYDNSAGPVRQGIFEYISDPDKLRSSMASYYNFFSKAPDGGKATVAVPYFDAFGLGMITTVSIPVYYGNKLKGVVGIDIPLSDLFSEALFSRHYFFVSDNRGRAIIHPLLPQPDNVSSNTIVAKLHTLEQNPNAASVLSSMQSGGSGSKSFTADHIITNGDAFRDGVVKQLLPSVYYWKKVGGTDFSVCLVMVKGDVEPEIQGMAATDQFLYHRIDLKPPHKLCRHFERKSTMETSVVKLSPKCFTDPYEYLDQVETESTVSSLTNYMKYKTSSYPRLKSKIRDTVTLLAKADEIWLKELTELTKYTAWRYIATYNGVIRILPGVKLEKKYDPTQRPWYLKTISKPGKCVLSTPYLDAFGAGFIVTLSFTLYKGNPSKTHNPTDTVVSVVGTDFTLGYFYETFIQKFPKCTQADYSCYLIDSSGYVVIHKDFVEATRAVLPEVEYMHLTVKDKDLATKLINNGYMTRRKCLDVAEMEDQTTWKVDLKTKSYVQYKTGTPQYEVWAVTGSNVFVVIRYQQPRSVSCPCSEKSSASIHDYKCRYTSNQCECPCYSQANYQFCKDKLDVGGISTTSIPCTPEIPPLNVSYPSRDEINKAKELNYCYQESCKKVSKKGYCMSLLGCSWCSREKNGNSLSKPYCDSQAECYLGVVGMPSPYKDLYPEDNPAESTPNEEENGGSESEVHSFPWSTLLPCLVGGFLFVTSAAMYYIRYKNQAQLRRQQAQPTAGTPMTAGPQLAPMSPSFTRQMPQNPKHPQQPQNPAFQQQQGSSSMYPNLPWVPDQSVYGVSPSAPPPPPASYDPPGYSQALTYGKKPQFA